MMEPRETPAVRLGTAATWRRGASEEAAAAPIRHGTSPGAKPPVVEVAAPNKYGISVMGAGMAVMGRVGMSEHATDPVPKPTTAVEVVAPGTYAASSGVEPTVDGKAHPAGCASLAAFVAEVVANPKAPVA